MKAVLLVLLPSESGDLEAALAAALEPHRLNEDDVASSRAHHWDYWMHRDDPPRFGPIAETGDCAERVASILTPDGRWHDLEDHGWRLMDSDSAANRAALARWRTAARAVLQQWRQCLAIEVIVHS